MNTNWIDRSEYVGEPAFELKIKNLVAIVTFTNGQWKLIKNIDHARLTPLTIVPKKQEHEFFESKNEAMIAAETWIEEQK